MKKNYVFGFIIITIIFEIIYTAISIKSDNICTNDVVKINELVMEIEKNYGNSSKYPSFFEYSILDENENVVYKTMDCKSESLNEAYRNKDTIVDFSYHEGHGGKIIIYNNFKEDIAAQRRDYVKVIAVISIIQLVIFIVYYVYLGKNIIKPFKKMNSFATRIAEGNLDIPLAMDQNNSFGAFTEAFDIMRCEIAKSRAAEKRATEAKKELVAKLSHDIKTPIASIKSYSELGLEISNEDKAKQYFKSINNKSDQMNNMITNLFNSTLEELEELNVNPVEIKSSVIANLIYNADYLEKSKKVRLPECNVFADKLRLQQVFDNIFINSYKYAKTSIETNAYIENEYLVISIRDFGNNVKEDEIPLLMEKFKRGTNTESIEGTGLGLYISKEFLKKMNGNLDIVYSNPGFNVLVYLRLK